MELDQIKSKVHALEAPEDAQGYEEGGYSFPTQNDLALFMDKHGVEPGFCWDWNSSLISMGAKNQRGKERGEEVLLENRTGVKFMEHDLAASMDYVLPPVFFAVNGRGQVNDREEGFAACPTYADWIGSSGKRKAFHQKLTDELHAFLGSVDGNYRGQSGEPADFVRHLTSRVRVQWSQIQTFFNDSYIKLRGQAKFSEKASWMLIGRYGAAMFEAMHKYRHVASRLNNPSSRSARVTLVWAVLQSHRVLNEFIRVQFASHPAIVKEISFFTLMERVDPGEVRKLEQEVDKLRGEVKDLRKAKELANNANNTVTQLKSNYDKLEKRLKRVEDKSS